MTISWITSLRSIIGVWILTLSASLTHAQSLLLIPNQPTPWMMWCPYSLNIIVNNPIPNAVVDTLITYPTGQLVSLSFAPGSAYTTATIPVSITSWSTDARRFSTSSSIKNNAVVGTLWFISLPMATGAIFSLPYTPWSKTDGNNLPDANGNDLLWSVSGLSYTFLTWPCIQDIQAPVFWLHLLQDLNNNWINGVNAYKIRADSDVRLTITDEWWPVWYGYNSSNQYISNIADNQWGTNLPTLSITVDGVTYTSSSSQMNVWPFGITRERLDRNYNITINPNGAPFGIEREITVTWQVRDRTNRRWVSNLGQFSYRFNAPRQPIVVPLSPLAGAIAVNPAISPVRLRVRDDRAWVDTNSISVTLDGIVYTPTSSRFSFTTWARATGGDWMDISIIPVTGFQIATTIPVIVQWRDRVGTVITSSNTYSFTTRAACALYWCGWEPLELWYNGLMTMYSNPRLVVTGGIVTVSGDRLIISWSSQPTVWTQTVIQYVPQYIPIVINGPERVVYINSGERIIQVQWPERIVIRTGESVIRYVAGKPIETYKHWLLVIREIEFVTGVTRTITWDTKYITGDTIYLTWETQIIIQTWEVIKYVTSGSTDIYVWDDWNNVSIKPLIPTECPVIEPLPPQIVEVISTNWRPTLIGILLWCIGIIYGISIKRS